MALRSPERSALVGGALVVSAFLLRVAIVSEILATCFFFFFFIAVLFSSVVSGKVGLWMKHPGEARESADNNGARGGTRGATRWETRSKKFSFLSPLFQRAASSTSSEAFFENGKKEREKEKARPEKRAPPCPLSPRLRPRERLDDVAGDPAERRQGRVKGA